MQNGDGHCPGSFRRGLRRWSSDWLLGLAARVQGEGEGASTNAPDASTASGGKKTASTKSSGEKGALADLNRRLLQLEKSVGKLSMARGEAIDLGQKKPIGFDKAAGVDSAKRGHFERGLDPDRVSDMDWESLFSEEVRTPSSCRERPNPSLPSSSHVTSRAARGVAGPIVRGSVSGVGLGTLFNLLENERLAGLLSLRNKQRELRFLFREGGIVRCEWDSARITAADGVGIACSWSEAKFDFVREPDNDDVDSPRSANVLLLDALRLRDEGVLAG